MSTLASQTRSERDAVRVTVSTGQHQVDLSVTSNVPLRTLAREVARSVAENLDRKGIDTSWLKEPDSELILSPVVGDAWDQGRTLGRLKVRDGDTIVLSVTEGNQRYPALVESMADATAQIRNRVFRAWDSDTSANFAAWAFPALISVTALAAVGISITRGGYVQTVLAAVFGVVGVIIGMATFAVNATRPGDPLTGSLSLTTHVALTTAGLLAVPGQLGVWSVIAGAGVAAASASVMLGTGVRPRWGHVAVLVPAIATLAGVVVIMLFSIWRPVSPTAGAAVVALFGLLAAYRAPEWSRPFAKLEMPSMLLPEGDMSLDKTADLVKMTRELSDTGSWESIVHQYERNIQARYITLGIFIGTGVLTAITAGVAAATAPVDETVRYLLFTLDVRWVTLWAFFVYGVVLAAVGTWQRDRTLRVASTLAGAATWLVYLLSLAAFSTDTSPARLITAVVLTLLAAGIACAWGLSRYTSESAGSMKNVERLESLMYVFPVINVAVLLDIFFHIRHL